MKTFVGYLIGALTAGCALASDLPTDIQGAVEAASKSAQSSPAYEPSHLHPFFHENVMSKCISLSFRDKTPFLMVLAIDANGRAIKFYSHPTSSVSRCLEETSATASFPVPPKAPYFAFFDIRFEQQR